MNTSPRLIAAVDFETFYDSKAGYSLTNLTPYEYVHDDRFNAYLIAVAYSDGRPTFVGSPKEFDWASITNAQLLAHNAAFDGMVLNRLMELGIAPEEPRDWLDTADMVAFLGVTRNLKNACKELLDLEVSKAVRTAMDGKTEKDLNEFDYKALIEYGGSDADECLALFLKYGDQWPQIERDISNQNREAAWRGIFVDEEAVIKGINTLSEKQSEAARQLPWVAEGKPAGSLPALASAVQKLGLPVPPSFRKNDPRFLEWEATNAKYCPFIQARIDYASVTPHIARLQNLRDHLHEGLYHSDVRYFGTHCLTGEHEVFTRDGWVRLSDWDGRDIMQWDPFTCKLVGYLPAKKFVAKNTEDRMIEIITEKVRCVMTLGHTVPVLHMKKLKSGITEFSSFSLKAEGLLETLRRGEELSVPFYETYYGDMYLYSRESSSPSGPLVLPQKLTAANVRYVKPAETVYCAEGTRTGFFLCRYRATVFVTGNTGRTASGSGRGGDSETASKINLLNLPKAKVFGVDMRGVFIPRPGYKFIIYDYGQIEARVIKWLAGDYEFVDALKREGNIYQAEAVKMGWAEPGGPSLKKTNKDLYQLAKACCLGLGYGMSATKFNVSCKSMGLTLDPLPQSEWPEFDRRQRFIIANQLGITGDLTAPRFEQEIGMFLRFDRIVQEWRQANSKVTAFWHSLEESLKKSALDQQEVHYFRLPSGRLKPYFRPRVKPEPKVFVDPETGMQKTQVRNALSAAVIKDKPATFFHGGSLAENIVQATSRDIMAQCAVDVEKLYPQCKFMWSCYDEIIFEVPEDMCEEMNKLIPEVMCHGPSISTWIDDKLPLEVEGGIFDRYCK